MEPLMQHRELSEPRPASPPARAGSKPKRRFRIEPLEERIAPGQRLYPHFCECTGVTVWTDTPDKHFSCLCPA